MSGKMWNDEKTSEYKVASSETKQDFAK